MPPALWRGLALFKNQNPARGRKLSPLHGLKSPHAHLRTRTPQGDGNEADVNTLQVKLADLRTRTPQGDGNSCFPSAESASSQSFKNQNPARGRKRRERRGQGLCCYTYLRTRTPQGDGNNGHFLFSPLAVGLFKNQNPARGRKPVVVKCPRGARRI